MKAKNDRVQTFFYVPNFFYVFSEKHRKMLGHENVKIIVGTHLKTVKITLNIFAEWSAVGVYITSLG